MINKSDYQRIASLLKHFDCNSREVEIYLQSLSVGSTSIQNLAALLKQNRITVHHAVEQLITKGLLFETRKGKKRLIAPEEPEVLFRLLQREENEIQQVKSNLNYVTGLLNSIYNPDTSIPSVKVYEGVDGFKRMLEESLDSKGEMLVFTYVDLFSKLVDPNYLENYFERRAKKGISTRLIFPPCEFAEKVNKKANQYKIQIKLLAPDLKWKSGIFMWNDVIAIKSFTEGKLTDTIIKNKDIADFFRNVIFETVWQTAKAI